MTDDSASQQQRMLAVEEALHEAIGHLWAGRLPEAESAYRAVLKVRPSHPDANNNLGALAIRRQQPALAAQHFRAALESRPNHRQYWLSYIDALIQAGQTDTARSALDEGRKRGLQQKVIESLSSRMGSNAPSQRDVDALVAMFADERYEEAERLARQMTARFPSHGLGWTVLGGTLKQKKQLSDALACMEKASALSPFNAEAHCNLGVVLQAVRRPADAEASYRRAIELDPNYAEAYVNIGLLHLESLRLEKAELAIRRALELKPGSALACNGMGMLLQVTNRLPDAEAAYRRALELRPNWSDAATNLGILLLGLGRYAEGWQYYESRCDRVKNEAVINIYRLSYPQWHGESLAGKSLVICPEQGFGDYIQFIRYAPLLKARGLSRLTVLCTLPLKALLETVAGVDSVVTDLAALPLHDYWSFPLSLPLRLGTTVDTIPAALPYLHVPQSHANRWRNRLPEGGSKVGLVWRGDPIHNNDARRSLPRLATLAPLLAVPGVTFISLQKGQGEEEANVTESARAVLPLGAEIQNFADTAAIVARLDLVICVDTAIAHVAGALNKPCWLLLPAFGTDWRWQLARTESPWYPCAIRLFRQTTLDDWSETIREVTAALNSWVTEEISDPSGSAGESIHGTSIHGIPVRIA